MEQKADQVPFQKESELVTTHPNIVPPHHGVPNLPSVPICSACSSSLSSSSSLSTGLFVTGFFFLATFLHLLLLALEVVWVLILMLFNLRSKCCRQVAARALDSRSSRGIFRYSTSSSSLESSSSSAAKTIAHVSERFQTLIESRLCNQFRSCTLRRQWYLDANRC